MRIDFHWHNYRYFPYERLLAEQELTVLFGQKPMADRSECLSIWSSDADWEERASTLTYFREVVAEDGTRVTPMQALLESSANGRPKNGSVESGIAGYRQSTRYSAHGLHEYRGKFNPQVVRVIGNLLALQRGSWVLDPFCGSGTTLLEAAHIGWNAVGIDLNPLAVEIAKAKIAALQVPASEWKRHVRTVERNLSRAIGDDSTFTRPLDEKQIAAIAGANWRDSIPELDYLSAWFTESVLVQIAAIQVAIDQVPSESMRRVFRVILSDLLRTVSLQDPDDLRIRRRKNPSLNMPLVPMFLDSLAKCLTKVLKGRQHLPEPATYQTAIAEDARTCAEELRVEAGNCNDLQFDAAITSPPYATALPYIDTQRLSLVALGLVNANRIRAVERQLTGNREISSAERTRLDDAIRRNADHLPDDCIAVCRRLKNAIDPTTDGFRRQNMAALVYKYLVDMSQVFGQVRLLLRPNAPFALVVGRNSTTLGGREFVVDTPCLLASLGLSNGYRVEQIVEFDTYQRYDLHQANSIRTESLLVLRRV